MLNNEWAGPNVRLRAIEPEDWEFFHEWNRDTEMSRLLYETHMPTSAASVQAWAQKQSLESTNDKRDLVIETVAGEIAGGIGIKDPSRRNGTFRHGIAVHHNFRRSGVASEALLIMLEFYFDELGYQKADADVYAFNEPSLGLHRKLGYTDEGRQRRMIYTEGQHHDVLWLGITAEEFRERHVGWRDG